MSAYLIKRLLELEDEAIIEDHRDHSMNGWKYCVLCGVGVALFYKGAHPHDDSCPFAIAENLQFEHDREGL